MRMRSLARAPKQTYAQMHDNAFMHTSAHTHTHTHTDRLGAGCEARGHGKGRDGGVPGARAWAR